ncbi:MAG: hypothetical protein VCA38_13630 [Roseibacillus sp.]
MFASRPNHLRRPKPWACRGPHSLQRELTSPPPPTLTVRRYQQVPTPLVRDKVSNWRTGRLDLVMRGHSDIIGS